MGAGITRMGKTKIHASGEDYLEAVRWPRKFMERHRILTAGLIDLGVDPNQAEQDACRIEHAISDESFQKLKNMLQNNKKAR